MEALRGLAACGEVKAAIEGLQGALRKNPDHAGAHYQLGLLWLELGEWDKAGQHLAQARDDEDTAAALQRLEQERGQLGNSYARHLFNDYAPRFDISMKALECRIPQFLAEALRPYLKSNQRIIDLGCGTGLMAPYLKPHAAELVGVDIAGKMLALAAERGLYDRLMLQDMIDALTPSPAERGRVGEGAAINGESPLPPHFVRHPPPLSRERVVFDIIVAADVVVYMGDLQPLFGRVAEALAADGVFALSIEVNGLAEGYVLQESKRHAHSLAYIAQVAAAAGLAVIAANPVVLRQDRGQPVSGAILVIRGNKVF